MARLSLAIVLLLMPSLAVADQAADSARCQQSDGTFLAGTVTNGPYFRSGKPLHGIYLSHTHLRLLGDDGNSYDVAIDTVFANGYHRNQRDVPPPLNSIRIGDRLELCGKFYSGGGIGIDWVHTDCGATRYPTNPTAGSASSMLTAMPATTWRLIRRSAASGRINGRGCPRILSRLGNESVVVQERNN
jgi:hypothetical protein